MEVLIVIVVIQFIYIIFKDITNARERERLQLKIISKDATEYKRVIDKEPEKGESFEDPFIPVEEASVEQILKANE